MKLNPRIFGAFLVGTGLLGVAYFFAPEITTTTQADATVEVVTGTAPDREFIPVEDSDNDGVPNWKEGYREVKPATAIYNEKDDSKPYTPPETLTGKVAIDVAEKSIRSQIYGTLAPSQEEMVATSLLQIESAGVDEQYTSSDLTISSDSSNVALRTYSNLVIAMLVDNGLPPETRDEIEILQHAVRTDNPEILEELTPIIDSYTGLRNSMLLIPVPSTIVKEHLTLLNVYNSLLIDILGMKGAFNDQLYSIVRMQTYFENTHILQASLDDLYSTIYLRGVRWTDEDLVSRFINIEE